MDSTNSAPETPLNSIHENNDAKQVFRKCGTCSQTFGHILNREFGHPHPDAEKALDPLAGGMLNQGHQCGMLWGAALGVGAEADRLHDDPDEAMASAILATQQVVDSFVNQTSTVNCREITGVKLNTVFGLTKFALKTIVKGMNNSPCFNMAEEWAPKAIDAADAGLEESIDLKFPVRNCAAEVAKRLGASEEEMVMCSGFSGGIGLSGHACGALGAAIWLKNLQWTRENDGKTPSLMRNKPGRDLMNKFRALYGDEILCSKITGQHFDTLDEHSDYIANGGCAGLIVALSSEYAE